MLEASGAGRFFLEWSFAALGRSRAAPGLAERSRPRALASIPTILYYLSCVLMIEAESRRMKTLPAPLPRARSAN